jgi:hypothetical protein
MIVKNKSMLLSNMSDVLLIKGAMLTRTAVLTDLPVLVSTFPSFSNGAHFICNVPAAKNQSLFSQEDFPKVFTITVAGWRVKGKEPKEMEGHKSLLVIMVTSSMAILQMLIKS